MLLAPLIDAGARRQSATGGEVSAREIAEELTADRRAGADGLAEPEARGRAQVHRGLRDVEAVLNADAGPVRQVVGHLARGKELDVGAVDDVVADRGPPRQPRQRPPVAGEPAGEAVGRLIGQLREQLAPE